MLRVLVCCLGLLAVSGGSLLASDYVGEFCWRADDNDAPAGEYSYLRLGISLAGGGHYEVNGRITDFEGTTPTEESVVSGGLEVIGGKLVASFTIFTSVGTPGAPGEFGYSHVATSLDPGTRNGSFRAMSLGWEPPGGFFGPEYGFGTLTYDADCTP